MPNQFKGSPSDFCEVASESEDPLLSVSVSASLNSTASGEYRAFEAR